MARLKNGNSYSGIMEGPPQCVHRFDRFLAGMNS